MSSDDRDELHRLREENLRLREEALDGGKGKKAEPTIVNVKQVNEGCLSGCAGLAGIIFLLFVFLDRCSGS